MTTAIRHHITRRLGLWATAALLGACATLRLDPDLSARAPALSGFGQIALPVTTRSADA